MNKNDLIIPEWLLKIADLTPAEKMVYALYYSYTFYGKYGCCKLINEEIYTRLGMSERNLRYIKKSLKDKKYIETDGGITVKALINE